MRIDLRSESATNAHLRDARVFLDGVEVTRDTFLTDDERGIVGLYLRDETDHFYRSPNGDGAAHEFRHGIVTIVLPERVKANEGG